MSHTFLYALNSVEWLIEGTAVGMVHLVWPSGNHHHLRNFLKTVIFSDTKIYSREKRTAFLLAIVIFSVY
jgi:hypothetical protein